MTGRFLVEKKADLVITSGRRPLFKTWKDNMLSDKMSTFKRWVCVSVTKGLFSILFFLPQGSEHTPLTPSQHTHTETVSLTQAETPLEHGLLMPCSRHPYHNLLQI